MCVVTWRPGSVRLSGQWDIPPFSYRSMGAHHHWFICNAVFLWQNEKNMSWRYIHIISIYIWHARHYSLDRHLVGLFMPELDDVDCLPDTMDASSLDGSASVFSWDDPTGLLLPSSAIVISITWSTIGGGFWKDLSRSMHGRSTFSLQWSTWYGWSRNRKVIPLTAMCIVSYSEWMRFSGLKVLKELVSDNFIPFLAISSCSFSPKFSSCWVTS